MRRYERASPVLRHQGLRGWGDIFGRRDSTTLTISEAINAALIGQARQVRLKGVSTGGVTDYSGVPEKTVRASTKHTGLPNGSLR